MVVRALDRDAPDGTTLTYIDADWKPVLPEKAVLVKIVYPDGRVIFARPASAPMPVDGKVKNDDK